MSNQLTPKGKYVKSIFSDDYRGIIDQIKKVRKDKKITQKELASLMGWPSWSYISKIENYERKLDCAEFVKITRIFDKPIEFFVEHIHYKSSVK